MDIERYFVLMLAGFAMAGNAQAGVKAAIVRLNEDGASYLYSAQKISPGETVHFQLPKNDRPSCCGRSHWKAVSLLPSEPDAVEYHSDRALYRYRLPVTGLSTSLPFLGIAVIGNKVDVEQDGAWRVKARQAGTKTDLMLCTSQEGVHVLSRRDGKAESHLYLYLGYDIENPTCASAIMK
jgi:hypothetical protein